MCVRSFIWSSSFRLNPNSDRTADIEAEDDPLGCDSRKDKLLRRSPQSLRGPYKNAQDLYNIDWEELADKAQDDGQDESGRDENCPDSNISNSDVDVEGLGDKDEMENSIPEQTEVSSVEDVPSNEEESPLCKEASGNEGEPSQEVYVGIQSDYNSVEAINDSNKQEETPNASLSINEDGTGPLKSFFKKLKDMEAESESSSECVTLETDLDDDWRSRSRITSEADLDDDWRSQGNYSSFFCWTYFNSLLSVPLQFLMPLI